MICEKSTIKLRVWLEAIHSILNFKVQETSFYESWYIYKILKWTEKATGRRNPEKGRNCWGFFTVILQIKVNETKRKESERQTYGFTVILIYLCIQGYPFILF